MAWQFLGCSNRRVVMTKVVQLDEIFRLREVVMTKVVRLDEIFRLREVVMTKVVQLDESGHDSSFQFV